MSGVFNKKKTLHTPENLGPRDSTGFLIVFAEKTLVAPRIWAPDGIFDLFIGLELARLKENRRTTLKREQIVKRFRFEIFRNVCFDSLSLPGVSRDGESPAR